MPLREIEKNLTVRKVEKGKKEEKKYGTRFYKARVLLDFSNIEYHIIFLITQILGQQCHTGDSLRTQVH